MTGYPDNPGPLPAEMLANKGDPEFLNGLGAMGNEHAGKMYYSGSDRKALVTTLQKMLRALGYDLGTSGDNGDGADGDFGKKTEDAVSDFQGQHKDWMGEPLKVDGLAGPRTSDALNRKMVGRWYDRYQTPPELTESVPCYTVTVDYLKRSLSIDTANASKARVFIVGEIPDSALDDTLPITIVYSSNEPVKNAKYTLSIDDDSFTPVEGVTDDAGSLSHQIPRTAKSGKLTLETFEFDLTIMHNSGQAQDNDKALPKKQAIVKTGEQNTLVIPSSVELQLGIEVEAPAGGKSYGRFDLGKPGGGYNPLEGFTVESQLDGISNGNLYSTKLDFKDLKDRAVRLRAGKSFVVREFNKDSDTTSYNQEAYPTEEMVSQIFIFEGEECLTGNNNYEDVLREMAKTRTGITRILIRLDEKGTRITDCIIDGVVHIRDGERKVLTGR